MKLRLVASFVFIIALVSVVSGCINSSYSSEEILHYWSSITSFTAQETIKIGNQTFESRVSFTKPGKIIREDYINGSLAHKTIIENGTQTVITANGTFTLNATIDDVNALDPFASMLNNLDSFNVTREGNTLFLTPKTSGPPSYEVELNGKLLKKIMVKQDGLVIVVDYREISVKT